jgi:hypothetical protein
MMSKQQLAKLSRIDLWAKALNYGGAAEGATERNLAMKVYIETYCKVGTKRRDYYGATQCDMYLQAVDDEGNVMQEAVFDEVIGDLSWSMLYE